MMSEEERGRVASGEVAILPESSGKMIEANLEKESGHGKQKQEQYSDESQKSEAFARSQVQESGGCCRRLPKRGYGTRNNLLATVKLVISLLLAAVLLIASLQVAHCDQSNDGATTTSSPLTTTELLLNADGTIGADANLNNNQTAHKIKPVNFTLVNELWEKTLEEPEVARRWRNMDNQLQDGMKSILKLLFPQIVAISQDAKVSGDCSGGILKWILSLRNLRSWAIKSKYNRLVSITISSVVLQKIF